jgi:hypothetical protein
MKKRLIEAKTNNNTTGCVLQEVPFEAEFEKIIAHDDSIEPEVLRGQKNVVVSSVKKGLKPLGPVKSNSTTPTSSTPTSSTTVAASIQPAAVASTTKVPPSPTEVLSDTSLDWSWPEESEVKENKENVKDENVQPKLNARKRPTSTTILSKHLIAEKKRRDEEREIRQREMEERQEERRHEKKRRLEEIERQQAVKQQQHADKLEIERSKVMVIQQYLEFLRSKSDHSG